MNEKLSILFYAKRAKTNSDGLIPIYLRVTVDGQRIEFSTKRFTTPEKWSTEGSCMKGTSAESRAINTYLDTLKSKVYDYQQQLIREGELITAESMRNKMLGVDKHKFLLRGIYQHHNDEVEALIGKDFARATLVRFKTSFQHTMNYVLWKYKTTDIDIRKIDHEFITGFEFYLKTECNIGQNTTIKYIKNLGKVIRICIANGWIDRNPFANYKCKMIEVERDFLSQDELNNMFEKKFSSIRLELVKDIFLFSCFTGLAYADVSKLTPGHVTIGIDGEKWIYVNRTKTDTRSNIPLLPIPCALIEKYKNHPKAVNEDRLLPILSNQKMNAYLKEIADICGINKELTFHIARHTFATTVTLTNGVPIESVSKMLGHKKLQTTQHYAKILDMKVSYDMRLLKEKYSNTKVQEPKISSCI